ncbi:MAG: hypothetical protein Q9209_007535 [Squamulea sp. 1 TL-2023]
MEIDYRNKQKKQNGRIPCGYSLLNYTTYVLDAQQKPLPASDIAHLTDDGAMVFHDRIAGNAQIKIRGFHIELTDIESNIVAAADGKLEEAVVTLSEGDPDFLVAHFVNVKDKDVFLEQLLSRLQIPQYMIPVAAISLDKLPLTNHSKWDRKAMKEVPLPQQAQKARDDEEMTETMIQLKPV